MPPSDAGFIVADESILAAALDAQLPGQGQADSLWISTSDPRRLRASLQTPRLASLSASFRGEIQHTLSSSPIARAVSRILVAGGVLAAVLAAAGLMLVILGPLRDRRTEVDLEAQGFGPRACAANSSCASHSPSYSALPRAQRSAQGSERSPSVQSNAPRAAP